MKDESAVIESSEPFSKTYEGEVRATVKDSAGVLAPSSVVLCRSKAEMYKYEIKILY